MGAMRTITSYLYQHWGTVALVIAIITWSVFYIVYGIRLDALHAFEKYCK